ncbi:MAG: ankyrin repeat domain-containing protein [Rhizobiales bacterium]|nr:ankyrin repeat domain-containing protein [Hyphomicrobiales bacterium]
MIIGLAVVLAAATPGAVQTMAELHDAVMAGDLARVDVLIKAGMPVDEKNNAGETALLLAVKHDKTAIAKALMAAGASINARAKNKDTPWLLAGASGRTEIIREMIPFGPDLSIRNRYGGNALIPACERGHVETIRLLLTTAIDVDHVNNLGWTCLLEIVILGDGGPRHVEAARLVLDAGANPNLADKDGVSPLAHARAKGQAEIATLIEKAGGKA